MLKAHGIHPGGGPLESLATFRDRSSCAMKASKKRKLNDTSPFMWHDEIEDQKPRMPQQRPRTPGLHNIKQEPPPMGYQPYMYHPMMSHQSPYMQRPVPQYVPQGMGQMPHAPGATPQYQMMPGMFHHNNFMMPPHQMPPFPTNQALPPLSHDQDQANLSSFDDFCGSDFTKCESFEGMLNGDSSMPNNICDTPDTQKPSFKQEQTSASLQVEPLPPIKSESNHPPLFDHPEVQPREEQPALAEVGTMAPPCSPTTEAVTTTSTVQAEALTKALGDSTPVKRERKDSFVLLSP